MLKQVLSIFRGKPPLVTATERFSQMLEITQEMILDASAVYWGKVLSPEERTALYDRDVEVNKLEREIRKLIIAHMSVRVGVDVPFGLLMMSLVKDVERLGDYAKNLAEVPEMTGQPQLPDDDNARELAEIRQAVETLAGETAQVWAASDAERARELTISGRAVSKRCDKLVAQIAAGDYSAKVAVCLTMGTRFYKRIAGHLLNLLSSVLMPLHKLDYYDEKVLESD
jgi:phosphate uptake regulator